MSAVLLRPLTFEESERLERVFPPDLLDTFDEIVELPALTARQVRAIAR